MTALTFQAKDSFATGASFKDYTAETLIERLQSNPAITELEAGPHATFEAEPKEYVQTTTELLQTLAATPNTIKHLRLNQCYLNEEGIEALQKLMDAGQLEILEFDSGRIANPASLRALASLCKSEHSLTSIQVGNLLKKDMYTRADGLISIDLEEAPHLLTEAILAGGNENLIGVFTGLPGNTEGARQALTQRISTNRYNAQEYRKKLEAQEPLTAEDIAMITKTSHAIFALAAREQFSDREIAKMAGYLEAERTRLGAAQETTSAPEIPAGAANAAYNEALKYAYLGRVSPASSRGVDLSGGKQ